MNTPHRLPRLSLSRLLHDVLTVPVGCLLIAFLQPVEPAWAADPSEAPFAITDLGMPGSTSGDAYAININGEAVGVAQYGDGTSRAFLYSNGTFADLGTLGGAYSSAFSINDRGQVAGTAQTADGAFHAFLYSGGAMLDLGTLGGRDSGANEINVNGQVVGSADTPDGASHAFLYSNGAMTDLGTFGGRKSWAYDINGRGAVVGGAQTADGATHAFLYSDGQMIDLGTLGGPDSWSYRINANGQVAGCSTIADYAGGQYLVHAFLYTPGGVMQDLGSLAEEHSCAYAGINNRGQVAGVAQTGWFPGETFSDRVFLYSPGRGTEDLGLISPSGGNVTTDMNNSGQVVGRTAGPVSLDQYGAFLAASGTGILYLNSVLRNQSDWSYFAAAFAINDRSQIVGFGGMENAPGTRGFLATPTFPNTGVLDMFDGPAAKLTKNWTGSSKVPSYKIRNQQVRVRDGGPIYWNTNTEFGPDQEAFVTLTKVDRDGTRQGLVLKAQASGSAEPDPRDGVIHVMYNAKTDKVTVRTFLPRGRDWTVYPPIAVEFQDGDQIGARVYTTGQVRIYKNRLPVATVNLDAADQAFFYHKGGLIGLKFNESADKAIFDDFGGGTSP